MKTKRNILLGIAVWMIAVVFYTISYFIPVMENLDTQANIVLFIVVIPLVWLGSFLYYKKDNKTHGFKVGLTMLLTSIVLDALITVPLFIMPQGGNHYDFFTAIEFWIIAFEFLLVAISYWYFRVYSRVQL